MEETNFSFDQDYAEDIKPAVLIPAGTLLKAQITSAEIVQPKSEIGTQIAIVMHVTDENEWFDKPLYFYVPIPSKEIHASKAAWAEVQKSKNKEIALEKGVDNLVAKSGKKKEEILSLLENEQDKIAALQGVWYSYFLTVPKNQIPKVSGFENVCNSFFDVTKRLGLNLNNLNEGICSLVDKQVKVAIGPHNEYPKGKFNQKIAALELI